MKSDIEIANSASLIDVREVAKHLNISEDYLDLYGKHKAKISLDLLNNDCSETNNSKLILVTSINPTPAGEGKTTVNIALSMALNKVGKKALSALREPSKGPVFGMKGGACGGGYSQILPMEDINLHFTGDIAAIESAHNLLAAIIDNHIYQGNQLNINPKNVVWNRVLDVNDRALRNIVIGMGPNTDGVMRESKFEITAASEIMAILCLAEDLEDLRTRLGRIIVAYNYSNEIIRADDLGATDSLLLLLKKAFEPNLVQTIENTPALIHGGPFANIAHGSNSIVALKLARQLADYVVTEAGFGADLGAEKFFDIVSRNENVKADAVVLVATVKALKYNGGQKKEDLEKEDLDALREGFSNLKRHMENVHKFGRPFVVAINRFPSDTEAEIKTLQDLVSELGVEAVVADPYNLGSEGAIDLANKVIEITDNNAEEKFIYDLETSFVDKIEAVATEIYRADKVVYSSGVKNKLRKFEKDGYKKLPVCIAKTQYSFSDKANKLGAPTNFEFEVTDVELKAGAGFVVVKAGSINTMPGLPQKPAAMNIKVGKDGTITGLA
ncbi:formate--tetrahydrofolate ligase [Fastidiosipila sanguinis]|uniref:Formate--tetrahydrofolate ligase n=1 Tax=Fastidiosipila sanguinis TaxID=236753 RepID=A0A2S0KMX0_9FIRM|nr:formate--tetrahydrofolate ligase [Fastidiosipila sanguinis]AVM42364.1 formate--tetrahydrofolate ligase [Fastidiosipila sanguinis]